MSPKTKITLAIVVVLLLLCAHGGLTAFLLLRSSGRTLNRAVVTDPQELADVGRGIADYQLPPGYQAGFGLKLLGFSLVAFVRGDEQHIMLMQFPPAAGLSQVEMEQELHEATQHETGDLRDVRVVDRPEVTIKGDKVVLVVSQGMDVEGQLYQMESGIFQGRGGPTLLWIAGPAGDWDQPALDAFIASIR